MRNRLGWIVAAFLVSAPVLAEPAQTPPASAPASPATPPAQAPPTSGDSPPSDATFAPEEAPSPAAAPSPATAPVAPPAKAEEKPEPAPATVPPPPPAARPPTELPPTVGKPPADEVASEATPLGEPRALGLELGLSFNDRFESAKSYNGDDRGTGVGYGLGFWMNLAPRAALGAELKFVDLGRASAASGQNLIDTEFASTGLWLGGRLFPWQNPYVRLFVELKLGLVLQHVDATGVRQASSALAPATSFECSGWGGPELGLGAGLGAVVRLNSRLDVVPALGFRNERFSSDQVDGCASGAGSASSFSAGLGLAYGFDGPKSSGP